MTTRTLADIDVDLATAYARERNYLTQGESALAGQQRHRVDGLLDERCRAMGLEPAV